MKHGLNKCNVIFNTLANRHDYYHITIPAVIPSPSCVHSLRILWSWILPSIEVG